MASFVLVHGSGQHAGCWSRLGKILEERGHAVETPDLPKKAPEWGLKDYAGEIAKSMAGPGTVLVGHSASGAFLPLVSSFHECGLLVFLAAVIPEPGKSVREQFTEDPSMFNAEWIDAGRNWSRRAGMEDLARKFLFHDCDEETLSWALGTLDILDTRHLVTEPAPFKRWPDVPVASIVAAGDRTLTPDWSRRTTRRVLRTEAIDVDAGHCPHVSRPDTIASILEELVAGKGPAGS